MHESHQFVLHCHVDRQAILKCEQGEVVNLIEPVGSRHGIEFVEGIRFRLVVLDYISAHPIDQLKKLVHRINPWVLVSPVS